MTVGKDVSALFPDVVNCRTAGVRKSLPNRSGAQPDGEAASEPQATVIPNQESLIGDLLSMDIGAPPAAAPAAAATTEIANTGAGLLGDIFGLSGPINTMVQIPKITWLPAEKGKGMEVQGSFSRRNAQIHMDMTFTNKAMSAMSGFAIQLNKNSFGLTPTAPLQVPVIQPGQSAEVSLALGTGGVVQRMEPLNNLQVAIKNNVDIFYFACLVHANVLFAEDGQLDKRVFLTTWKEIPAANEVQYSLSGVVGNADTIANKMTSNNVFTIAKRNVEGQDMLYQSLKLTNNIWVLLELKVQPGNPDATLSLKSRSVEVAPMIFTAYEAIIRSS
uniref:Beta-adaptin appendage C-terminal subdomain domain-containing protein n=1 Tax=Megaselia scalaris TaxID=36166 RepID=T1GYI4_MEGSC